MGALWGDLGVRGDRVQSGDGGTLPEIRTEHCSLPQATQIFCLCACASGLWPPNPNYGRKEE